MRRIAGDMLLLGVVFPYILMSISSFAMSGNLPLDVDSLMGIVSLAPFCLLALAVWYGLSQEWRWEVRSAMVRNALRALKATWVLVLPGLLIGARWLPPVAALTLLLLVVTYVTLRSRWQRGTSRL